MGAEWMHAVHQGCRLRSKGLAPSARFQIHTSLPKTSTFEQLGTAPLLFSLSESSNFYRSFETSLFDHTRARIGKLYKIRRSVHPGRVW